MSFDPEKNNNYAPNAVQLELLRLLAKSHWYLALGDTDHSRPQIRSFALCTQTVKALSQGGVKNYFQEDSLSSQKYFDSASKLERSAVDLKEIFNKHKQRPGYWHSRDVREKLLNVFESAAQDNQDIRFIASDRRHDRPLNVFYSMCKLKLFHILSVKFHTLSLKLYRMRALEPIRAIAKYAYLNATLKAEKELNKLKQDHKSAEYIKGFNTRSAIFFGSGHFEKNYQLEDEPHLLGTLLPSSDHSMCKINIYEDERQRETDKEKKSRSNDFDLIVRPKDGVGIIVNNPDLNDIFLRAQDNALKCQSRFRPNNNSYIAAKGMAL